MTQIRTRKPKITKQTQLQTDAIRRRLANHPRSCTYWIFSGDRHCSCGRDLALAQLQALEEAARKVTE